MRVTPFGAVPQVTRPGILKLGLCLGLVLSLPPALRVHGAEAYQGFGATTPGGAGGTVVRVTNLDDSGPGSFREAVSEGNRIVVFDVAGDVLLSDYVYVTGAFITIDGLTAPDPGITLRNRGLIIRGNRGAHDVIVRGIRVRDSPIDGIQIAYGAYNVVVDHVSVHGSGDGNLDITEGSHDVTVSWSILAEPASGKNMLIKYNPSRITLHHNLFVRGSSRNPQVRIDDAGTPATDTTVDMRNNLVRDWGTGYGTLIWYGPQANVVDNYYAAAGGDDTDTLTVDAATARAHVAGNVSEEGLDLDATGTEQAPFPAPSVDTQETCNAASLVLGDAGVTPRDSLDEGYLTGITLAACPGNPSAGDLVVEGLGSSASSVVASKSVTVSYGVANRGTVQVTETYTDKIYLSTNATFEAGDVLLGTSHGHTADLSPNATHSHSQAVTVPADTAADSYFLLVQTDALGAVAESLEGNNVAAVALTVTAPPPPGKDLVVEELGLSATTLAAGSDVTLSYRVANRGTVKVTETYTDWLYLSSDAIFDAGDALLGQSHDHTADLKPNATHSHSQAVTVPADTAAGPYFLLVQADALGVVAESLEGNNVTATPVTVTSP